MTIKLRDRTTIEGVEKIEFDFEWHPAGIEFGINIIRILRGVSWEKVTMDDVDCIEA